MDYGQAKLTFLGTGTSQGVPIIGCKCEVCTSQDPRDKRLRASAYVEYGGLKILVDAGPDFRMQMLERYWFLSASKISARQFQSVGFLARHPKQFSSTHWVSYNSTQF